MSGIESGFDVSIHRRTVSRATANLPQSAQAAIFTVTVGRILVLAILGEVTTGLQAVANATQLIANPTVGSDVPLCATLDITGDEQGTLYGITGIFSDPMLGVNAGAVEGQARGAIVPIGTIDLSTGGNASGQVQWDLIYVPLDEGATVVAA